MPTLETTAPRGMFIDGELRSPSELDWTTIRDPATGAEVGAAPRATPAEIDVACDAAERAFADWSDVPASARGVALHQAAEAVMEQVDELSLLLTREQGKPVREAKLEIRRFVHTLEHYAGLAKNLRGGHVPDLDEATHGLILKRPIGVVAAIVPWNFPTTLLGNKLGPALVTGNTVVAKPAETTPLTTLRIAELMHEAGIPAGVFNVVTGRGSELGEPLVKHPAVGKVAFTGSTPVGQRIMAMASEGIKRLTLELGGSDPMIVCSDADIDAAVSAASVGRFFNCGQACLAIKRLYVFDEVADEVIEKLVGKVSRLRVGLGTEQGVAIGPLHTDEQRSTIEEQVADALDSGAELILGGSRPSGEPYDAGFFYEPTLLFEPDRTSRVATEEVFGPALPIWRVRDLTEAIERANDSIFGLGSSIFTRDLDSATLAADQLNAGYTWVNSPQKVYDELPFGGVGQSGFGKEHGIEALDYYTESKSVVVKRASREG